MNYRYLRGPIEIYWVLGRGWVYAWRSIEPARMVEFRTRLVIV